MKYKIGEEVELICDDGYTCGKYTIDEIEGEKVYFKAPYGSFRRPFDKLWRCKKIIQPGEQLLFEFMGD